MYKNILVLLDCSPVDDPIVDHVKRLAAVHGSKVCLLHVVHSHTLDQDRTLTEQARFAMDGRTAEFAECGIDAKQILGSGEPEDEIVRIIDENDFDLIALSTHGHKLLADFFYGSVSDRLKHCISVPLLMISGKK